ncbi:MAG: prolipoprotein diacylglyceryl transferase [Deltaproteobacteria bacterium]|nr:prolipoprotein diacylglyceryl transferase [Deltaproteobacteria bacterium]
MLPVLWRFTFDTPLMQVVLYLCAAGLVVYGAYAGWRGAENREQAPMRAGIFAVISAVVAYYGVGYAKEHGAPLHTYGLMIATAFIVAITLCAREARRSFPGIKKLADGTIVPMGEYMHETIMDLAFYVLVSGLVGARILFIIVNWKDYADDPKSIFSLSGGLVFYGGFIGAALTVVWYGLKHKLNVLRLGDIIVPTVSVAHAIGRFGCLSAGCCWGGFANPTGPFAKIALAFPSADSAGTWAARWGQSSLAFESQTRDHRLLDAVTHQLIMNNGVQRYVPDTDAAGNFLGAWKDTVTGAVLHNLPQGAIDIATEAAKLGHTLPIYPTQLMESIGELCIFTILVLTRSYWKRFHGQVLAMYLMMYSVLRTTVEMFRGDEERGRIFGAFSSVPRTAWYNISTSQFVSLAIFATGIVIWARFGRRTPGNADTGGASTAAAAA